MTDTMNRLQLHAVNLQRNMPTVKHYSNPYRKYSMMENVANIQGYTGPDKQVVFGDWLQTKRLNPHCLLP